MAVVGVVQVVRCKYSARLTFRVFYSWHVHMFVLYLIVYVTFAHVKGREICICTLFCTFIIIGVLEKEVLVDSGLVLSLHSYYKSFLG